MKPSGPALASVAIGVVTAYATDVIATSRLPARHRLPALSAGLVIAALIYPAARRPPRRGGPATHEWLAVAATVTAGAVAARRPPRQQTAIVAAGWACHAAFDLTHRRGPHSCIPDWYPAVCAGYDVALAALLAARVSRTDRRFGADGPMPIRRG
ncbi:MAG TPA: hypothetical protein VEG38_22400 [Acidimicrobiia bacterium]|nr:hypothetical protein [Acidimicrobiia bacterium]